jgi:hypothetical protein
LLSNLLEDNVRPLWQGTYQLPLSKTAEGLVSSARAIARSCGRPARLFHEMSALVDADIVDIG